MSTPPEPNSPALPSSKDGRNRSANLGKYRLTAELGRGGMGRVYAAEDSLLHRTVAIKLLARNVTKDANAGERFLREARAAAKLNHPCVVAIHEIDQRDGRWYIVMEHVAEGSLQNQLDVRGALPWPDATGYISDACRGLIAAHAVGLIHRDVKPANLMLAADGRVKVADFGLAKTGEETATLTVSGTVVGTPYYMSPEQWRAEQLTDLSDVYSLGATYYTLLTGQPPYAGRDAMQVMYACCGEPPPDPRAIRPDIPEVCAAIVMRAMAKEPADRFENAAAMLNVLESVNRNEDALIPAVARNISMIPANDRAMTVTVSVPKLSRRSLLGIAGGSAVLLAGGAYGLLNRSWWSGDSWQPLFNGKDLSGWWNRQGTWEVEKGVIVGRGPNGYLYSNSADYGDFHCRAEVKINATGNGGLFFRCEPQAGMPQGYEAQIGSENFGELHRVLHGTPERMSSGFRAVAPDQWQMLEVIANGGSIKVLWQGNLVSSLTEQYNDARVQRLGAFGFQAFDENTVLSVRRIEWRKPS